MRELLEKLIERYGGGCGITYDANSITGGRKIEEEWTISIPNKQGVWDFYNYKSESDMIAGANHLIAKPRQDGE
jgi:hypothetical protein